MDWWNCRQLYRQHLSHFKFRVKQITKLSFLTRSPQQESVGFRCVLITHPFGSGTDAGCAEHAGGKTREVHSLTGNSPDNCPRYSQTGAIRPHGEFMPRSRQCLFKCPIKLRQTFVFLGGKNKIVIFFVVSSFSCINLYHNKHFIPKMFSASTEQVVSQHLNWAGVRNLTLPFFF